MAKPKVKDMRERLTMIAKIATAKAGNRGTEIPPPAEPEPKYIPKEMRELSDVINEAWDYNCSKQRTVLSLLGKTIETRLGGENTDDWDCLVPEKKEDYDSRFKGNDLAESIPMFAVLEVNDPEDETDLDDKDLVMVKRAAEYDEEESLLYWDGETINETINDTRFVVATEEQVEKFVKGLPKETLEEFWYLY